MKTKGCLVMAVPVKKEWYLEYEITMNRAGLLGDVSSLLGMMGISIVTINGVEQARRGLLIKSDNLEKVSRFENIVWSEDKFPKKLLDLRTL